MDRHPGAFIFFSFFKIVTTSDDMTIMKFYPIFLMAILSLGVYVLARNIIRSNICFIAPITFIAFSWFLEYHLSPQSLSFYLYIVMVLILLKVFMKILANQKIIKFLLVFFILLASTIISHPGTPIFLGLNIIFGIFVLQFLIPNEKRTAITKSIIMIFLSLFIVFIIWNTVGENTLFESIKLAVERFLKNPLRISSKHIDPRKDYALVNVIRGIESFFEVLFTFVSLLLLYRYHKNNKKMRRHMVIIGSFVVSIFLWLAFSLYSFGHYIERPFMFCLVFLGPLSAMFLSINNITRIKFLKIAFILVLVVAILAIPITRYANEPFEYPPTTTLTSMKYVDEHFDNKKVLTSKLGGIVHNPDLNVSYIRRYEVVLFDDVGFNYFEIYLEKGQEYNETENVIQREYNKIYSTPYSAVYLNLSQR